MIQKDFAVNYLIMLSRIDLQIIKAGGKTIIYEHVLSSKYLSVRLRHFLRLLTSIFFFIYFYVFDINQSWCEGKLN